MKIYDITKEHKKLSLKYYSNNYDIIDTPDFNDNTRLLKPIVKHRRRITCLNK